MQTTVQKPARRTGKPKMGMVTVTIKVANYVDWANAQNAKGKRKPKVRTVIIPDALVDTGTFNLCLPKRYIQELGLQAYPGTIMAQTANGVVERRVYGGAQLTIHGRTDEFRVTELPDDMPALIGCIPLEALDFIVDPTEQKLVGKHGDKRITLMY